MPKLTTNPQAESFYGVSPYIGMGNNPVLMVDPDGEFVLAAFIIGAIAGGFSGYKVAEAKGYDLGDLKGWAYMLGGCCNWWNFRISWGRSSGWRRSNGEHHRNCHGILFEFSRYGTFKRWND